MKHAKAKLSAVLVVLAAAAAGVWYMTQPAAVNTSVNQETLTALTDDAMVLVRVPSSLSKQETMGKTAYEAVCADCHGQNAQGKATVAPPLVHPIYEPSHHGDMAFVLAAQNGVRAHHWKFGNMPAVPGVTQADVLNIVAYIRVLQRENGID